MDEWQRFITKGNYYFSQQNWLLAEQYYLDAVECADFLYRENPNSDKVMIAWITSYHNLADTYQQLRNITEQKENIYYPYYQLSDRLRIIKKDDQIYSLLLNALNLCYKQVLLLKKSNPAVETTHSNDLNISPFH